MEKRIELELRGRTPSEISDLNLDNCRATQITGLTDEYTSIRKLSLINVGLLNLKGLPSLPSLKKLELSDNKLSDGFAPVLAQNTPNITHLNLSGNKINNVEVLKELNGLSDLKCLDMFNCEIQGQNEYRQKVFALLPKLTFLDGFDREGNEAEESEDDFGEGISDDDVDDDESEEEEEVEEGEGEEEEEEEVHSDLAYMESLKYEDAPEEKKPQPGRGIKRKHEENGEVD